MAVDNEVLSGLRFEFGYFGRHITFQDGRVTPVSLLQSGRNHILADAIHSVPVLTCSVWESRREELVSPSTHEHRLTR
jgi:hypothetical protein